MEAALSTTAARGIALSATLGLLLTACSSEDRAATDASTESAQAKPTQRSSPTAKQPAIVGRWERVTTCKDRVKALTDAGLGKFATEHAAGEGWLPGVTSPAQIKDPQKPCEGAVPLKHGHFFTEDGLFGSTDAQGTPVDDGSYDVIDENTIIVRKEFGNVTFDYQVNGEGSLALHPVMPNCTKAGCFAAQWAIAVSYNGLPWQPVD